MLEAVGALARDRRPALPGDEVAPEQVVEGRFELEVGRELLQHALPEDAADDRSALERDLLAPRQPIDAGRDDRLEGVGDPLPGAPALEQHPRRLLHEERVALGLLQQRTAVVERELAVGEQRIDELLAVGLAERLQLDRGRAQAAAAPAGPEVEQLGPREADDQEGRILDPLGQVLDEIEQRLLGPVDVLEHEHERLRGGELGRPLARCPGDLLLAALGLDSLQHARRERQQVGDGVVAAAGAELRHGLLDRVVVGDPGRDLHHLGQRPVGDPLAVRQGASGEHRRALDAGDELAHEPALAHAGLAVDREDVRALVLGRPREGHLQQLELEVAADEGRGDGRDAARRLAHGLEQVHRERRAEASEVERALLGRLDRRGGEAMGEGAEEDLARRSGLLKPGCQVDRLAGRERRLGVVGDDLAGLDPDPRLQPEPVHGIHDRDGRAHGPLGVVLVRLRDAERRHDRVAGELLDDAAVGRDAVRDVLEEGRHTAADDLRIACGDELGRADQIDEDDSCELPFHRLIVDTRVDQTEAREVS